MQNRNGPPAIPYSHHTRSAVGNIIQVKERNKRVNLKHILSVKCKHTFAKNVSSFHPFIQNQVQKISTIFVARLDNFLLVTAGALGPQQQTPLRSVLTLATSRPFTKSSPVSRSKSRVYKIIHVCCCPIFKSANNIRVHISMAHCVS